MKRMSGLSSLFDVINSACDTEVLTKIGVVLGACLMFIFKSVRDTSKSILDYIVSILRPKRGQHIYSEHDNKNNEDVNDALFRIGVLTGAARVSVWQFHNGDTFTLSKPVFKIRSSYEYDRPGTTPDCAVINDVLVTQCMPIVGPLIDRKKGVKPNEGISFIDYDKKDIPYGDEHRILRIDLDELSYGAFKWYMERLGTKYVYAVLMKTSSDKPFGIITIQYRLPVDPDSQFKEDIAEVCGLFSRIQFTLDNTAR